MTNRIERLQQLLERESIARPHHWLALEKQAGKAGATLEMPTLFCAIRNELLDQHQPDWLHSLAHGHSPLPPQLSAALRHLADANVDPVALGEVIRYFQMHMAWVFMGV